MKKTFARILLMIFVGLPSFLASCSQDEGTDIKVPIAGGLEFGFLCTIGEGPFSLKDTLVYNNLTTAPDFRSYIKGQNNPEYKIRITPLGGGAWSVTRIDPYIDQAGNLYTYFSYREKSIYDSGFPNATFRGQLSISFAPNCEFILTRDDANSDLFYLEAKLYPGNYLGVQDWTGSPYRRDEYLVLQTKKQAFFILSE